VNAKDGPLNQKPDGGSDEEACSDDEDAMDSERLKAKMLRKFGVESDPIRDGRTRFDRIAVRP